MSPHLSRQLVQVLTVRNDQAETAPIKLRHLPIRNPRCVVKYQVSLGAVVCLQGNRHADLTQGIEQILHEVAGVDTRKLEVVAQQDNLPQSGSFYEVPEQPMEDLSGNHTALVYSNDLHLRKLPRTLHLSLPLHFIAADDLVDGESL